MRPYALAVLACLLFFSCKTGVQMRAATKEDVNILPRTSDEASGPKISPSYDPLSYVAYPELIRLKYIRVNFHFMNSTDGKYCIPEDEVGPYAYDWIAKANYNLERNMKMFLPHGNTTPAMMIPYRYVITPDPSVPGDDGVYYHVDDELCYAVKTGRERNISDKRVIKKYAVRADSVLNIFVQTHHLDSIKSKTYKPDASGISLGTSVKIFGLWMQKPDVWGLRPITNHEIGHSLGLSHTWTGHDGCDDTPPHPNCYNKVPKPPCDTMYSNNMMDYNAHMAALTPCQIGKVLMNMGRLNSLQRNLLQPRWCNLDTTANITVTDSMRWNGHMDLEGNLILSRNAVLEINSRVSLPQGGYIEVHPGAKLVLLQNGKLHNACGDLWKGIFLLQEKKASGQLFVMEGATIENIPGELGVSP